MAKKCKDESHVDAVPGTASTGDAVGVWSVTFVPGADCRNLPGVHPGVFVLCRNGKPKMQMLRSLALVLPVQLRASAAWTPAIRIRHEFVKVRVTFATLLADAALELAGLIDACVAAHP